MPKQGTIFNRIFHKDKKTLNIQRVVISDAQKRSADESDKIKKANAELLNFTDIFEENLEDTPSVPYQKTVKQQGKHSEKKKHKGVVISNELPVSGSSRDTQRRYKAKKGFTGKITSVFSKEAKTSNTAALEFAESKRRVGKKGRRNRKIAIYAGTGIIVVVLMLVIVLVPGGAAAPADAANTTPGTAVTTQGAAYVANNIDKNSPETSEPTVTETESSTPTEPSEVPTVTETPQPTVIETTAPDKTLPPVNVAKEVESFKVESDLYYNEVGYSTNYYEYTDEEFYMLAQVIHAEARGEGKKGMIAVGNVVMNRVLGRGFPGSTIKDVVTRPGQFAYNPNTKPGAAARSAARAVLDSQVWVIPQNVYFFKVSSSKSNWGSHVYQFNIGAHAFYSANYGGRYRGDAIPPALYDRTYQWPTMGCKPEERVYRLQYMLNKLGYSVKADKYFGKDTKDAIIDFQKKKGLDDDGVAGPATLEALIYEFGLQNYYNKFLA